jgi:hypothetical protein
MSGPSAYGLNEPRMAQRGSAATEGKETELEPRISLMGTDDQSSNP